MATSALRTKREAEDFLASVSVSIAQNKLFETRLQCSHLRHCTRSSRRGAWVTELSETRGPTTVIRSYGILAAILDIAARDRRIADNPARGICLPKKTPQRRVCLSHEQLGLLVNESHYPAALLTVSRPCHSPAVPR